jgi:hypothetical protein
VHRRPVASIALKRIDLPGIGSNVGFFTGERPRSHFLPWPQWPLDRIRRWRNARKTGNVAHAGAEVDMTRIAYAWPREIHLAVVGDPGHCNIFPTDLHGVEGADHYLISLRHAGNACSQVIDAGSFALFRMPLERFREVYALGARHMGPFQHANEITAIQGEWNRHALPTAALSARSLRIEAHADAGIHRVIRARIEKAEAFGSGPVLAHVHAAPATWLARHGGAPDVRLR